MKQILQNLKDGRIEVAEIPSPAIKPEHLLIQTSRSLISAGTEKMLLDFGRAGWIDKARQQPDKVRQVLDKIKTDGFLPTLDAVRSKLGKPLPLGYANVGTVLASAASPQPGIPFKPGDRVVSNGYHAETVCVSRNLCARVPDLVSDREAVFTVPGAIALQGIRLTKPEIGETVFVTGLGLIGLITVQLLVANGCRVAGLDPDPGRCRLAQELGAETAFFAETEEVVAKVMDFTGGRGVDAVIITAATTSNEPVHQAARMSRKLGRIVLVGVTGLELQRGDFYEKELSFQVSCSYGPGRYDPEYETRGRDYPYGYVRWTEQRNFETVLEMIRSGKLNMKALITHEFALADAAEAYALISSGAVPYLGVIFEYHPAQKQMDTITIHGGREKLPDSEKSAAKPVIGMIGAGNYTGQVLLPAIAAAGCRHKRIASNGGVTAGILGKKFGFESATTDSEAVFSDPEINTVFITTPHNSHCDLVLRGLASGKHVFVEKPMCLTMAELEAIMQAGSGGGGPALMVGFNRRFAPHIVQARRLLADHHETRVFVMTVNSGKVPADHWVQDPEIGGGRIIGEVCHFIDLLNHLADSRTTGIWAVADDSNGLNDTLSVTLGYENGSLGTIHYLANGNKAFPKERLEIFSGGRVLQLDNFNRMRGYGWPGFKKSNLWRQDKGHRQCMHAFLASVSDAQPSPIAADELFETTRISILVDRMIREGIPHRKLV